MADDQELTIGALTSAVHYAIAEINSPAVELALAYARQIDAVPPLLSELGPKLLACLESLQLTPRARALTMKGAGHVASNPADELRARRAARERDAAAVHATAP